MSISKPETGRAGIADSALKRLFFTTDSVGGWISIAVGTASLVEGLRLGAGTLSRLGSGAIPLSVGILLLGLGALLIIGSLRKGGKLASVPISVSAMLIIVALASFAVLLPLFGFVPAAIVLMLISIMAATGRVGLIDVAFAVAMSGVATAVFINGLGIVLPIVRWPF